MWIEGVHESVYRRQSLKTSSWERAEELKRQIERGEEKAPELSITEAKAAFLEHLKKKRVSPGDREEVRHPPFQTGIIHGPSLGCDRYARGRKVSERMGVGETSPPSNI